MLESRKEYDEIKKQYFKDLLESSGIKTNEEGKPENEEEREKAQKIKKKALECALDIRKFEIELYWKRANYFWAFIAIIFTGYFALLGFKKDISPFYYLMISLVGYMFSFSWYLVNRGSKFWQQNWEMHVDFLEDDNMGSLYKMVKSPESYRLTKLLGGYPSSVSKINQLLSIVITIVWVILTCISFYRITVDYTDTFLLSIGITRSLVCNTAKFVACIIAPLLTIVISATLGFIMIKATKSEHDETDYGKPYTIRSLMKHIRSIKKEE